MFLERLDDEANEETIDIRAIRLDADKALTSFFNAIEFCSEEYEELDYVIPAKAMNEVIDHYKAQLKARVTRRNEGKDVSTEDPITGAAI